MKKRMIPLRFSLTLAVCLILSMAAAGAAMPDSQSAIMKPPAMNAAVVADMPGFKNYTYKSFFHEMTVNEGLVIRQSRVENGKIIIPPNGLYYTTRTSPIELLKGEKTMILGKMYNLIDNDVQLDVLSNVFAEKKKPILLGDGSKGLELTDLGLNDNGYEGVKATFKILKSSGNYYGNDFPVSADPKMRDISKGVLKNGTGKKTGSYSPGQGSDWTREFWDRSANTSGQSYIVVESTTMEGVKVKEFGSPRITTVYLTEKDAVELLLGQGEKAKVGDYTVTVIALGNNTATLELTSKNGKVTRKTLGPVNNETMRYLPADHLTRAQMLVRPEANDVQVSLDLFRQPFRNGKVALLGYYDVIKFSIDDIWPGDARFIVRPDT